MLKNKKILPIIIIFVVLSVFVLQIAVLGQAETQKMSSNYDKFIRENLPSWDKRILEVPTPVKIWLTRASIESVAKAVVEKDLTKIEKRKEVDFFRDKNRLIKIDRIRGRIRYVNRERQFDYETSPREPVSKAKAEEIIIEAGKDLGLPSDEFYRVKVDAVVALGGSTESKKIDEKIFRERLVTIERQINNLPVFGSMFRGSVSNKGNISRILVKWPDFRLSAAKQLRDKKAIINEIVKRIEEQAKGREVAINMRLAYIPRMIEEKVEYTAGIIVAVLPAEETGFIFTVMITE